MPTNYVSPNPLRIVPQSFLLYNEISTLPTNLETFYAINIFSDSPDGFGLLLGLCAALHSIAQHVFASVAARQFGVFTLRIAHIVHSLYNSTKGIFILMVPKDLNDFLPFVHAAETAN